MQYVASPQQQDVYDAVQDKRGGSLIVEAVAGAGKTTTLIEICKLISRGYGSTAFAAYNRAIADEIGQRLTDAGISSRSVRAATFHSFGFSAWRRVAAEVRVDEDKVKKICQRLEVPEELHGFVLVLVSLAKQRAIGVLCQLDDHVQWQAIVDHHELDERLTEDDPDPNALAERVKSGIGWSIAALKESIATDTKVVDFDDMIYAPLVHNVRMWQNDWVLVDEAQDTNPARRALAKRMLRPGGRLIAVGDPHQAIYGFTGADNDSLDVIAREFNARRMPLTVTYRCPAAVVAHARQWVSHITAHDSAPQGEVHSLPELEFYEVVKATHAATPDALRDSAILCRNTKPLVEMAFQFIRQRIPCHIEGRDIGAGIIALCRRWKSVKTVGQLREKVRDYQEREVARLMAKGQEQKAGTIADRVETLFVLLESMQDDATIAEVQTQVNRLFEDTEPGTRPRGVTLSTVHKSKGREWQTVYLFGRNRHMPSPYARQQWQAEQETNLIYVACTRAKLTLVEVVVPIPAKRGRS